MNDPTRTALAATFLLLSISGFARADSQWALEKSTLAYHVSHPLHETEGVSHEARGKAVCQGGQCEILVAVPVKSFDSGDSNRDLHMLQVARGAQFPMVIVRARVPETAAQSPSVEADLEIQFAGQTVSYKKVPFRQTPQGDGIRMTDTIPATLADFKIEPPTLLTVPTRNEIPIRVELFVRRQPAK